VLFQSMGLDGWISPVLPGWIQLTFIMVFVLIIGHIIIAAISPVEGEARLDERERQIFNRAGSLSRFILGLF
jgi:hypothetical protein